MAKPLFVDAVDQRVRKTTQQKSPDIRLAVRWYEDQAEGLSRHFLDELDRVVRLIKIYPFGSDGNRLIDFLISQT